jgi:mono/diheme cytochrome c family protein
MTYDGRWPVASGLDEASITTAAHRDDRETMPQRGTARSIFDAEPHSFNRAVLHFTWRGYHMRKLIQLVAAIALTVSGVTAVAADSRVARGEYLVRFGSCNDCHTPGYFLGKPDSSRFLGGSDVGFDLPGLGTFVGPNLTPDDKTGLGNWSRDQIIAAIQTGVRPDGRILAPIMPWRAFAGLTKSDAGAIADYLKSLPPVSHKVPGPFGSGDKPPVPRMMVVFPAGNN